MIRRSPRARRTESRAPAGARRGSRPSRAPSSPRRGIAIDQLLEQALRFRVAVLVGAGHGQQDQVRAPPWPASREPWSSGSKRAQVRALVRVTDGVSLHFPWDLPDVSDAARSAKADLKAAIAASGLQVDSTNSNTFQDQPDQRHSYRIRQPDAHGCGGATGDRTQHAVPRTGGRPWRAGPCRVDRRRRKFSGPGARPPRVRALRGQPASDLCACPTGAGCSSSTNCSSRRSIQPW